MLGLAIKSTDKKVQKIDDTMLNTYEIVTAVFLITDKANRVRFFEKTFLVANVSPNEVFEMLFLTLNNADIDFIDQTLVENLLHLKDPPNHHTH